MQDERQTRSGWLGPSNLILALVLAVATIGAISLARQRPQVPPRIPPSVWALAGHDTARSGQSLSYPAALVKGQITLRWWHAIEQPIARPPVIDGNGNIYLARADGALVGLSSNGDKIIWCVALQPIADTACPGPQAPVPPEFLPPPVAPSALAGPDGHLYVVAGGGVLAAFDPPRAAALFTATVGLLPDDGLSFSEPTPGGAVTLYGVRRLPGHGDYTVTALQWRGRPVPGWHTTPLASRGLTPVSVAPDGTLLVAASAPAPGGVATLYALDNRGYPLWHTPLAVGRPSYVSVAGTPDEWVAWVAVAGATRSWVIATSEDGHALRRWSVGHPLDVIDGGVALAHRTSANPGRTSVGYVGSSIGVYAFDLRSGKPWLFFDTRTRHLGAAGPPTLDHEDYLYVGTDRGHVYNVGRDGHVRWSYDMPGRDARGPIVLDANGAALVVSHDAAGAVVAEALGAGGQPLATTTVLQCAGPDCPTPTATPVVSPTATPSSTVTPTTTPTPTPTDTITPTPTLTDTPTPTDTATPTDTPTDTMTPTDTPTETDTPTPTNTVTPATG